MSLPRLLTPPLKLVPWPGGRSSLAMPHRFCIMTPMKNGHRDPAGHGLSLSEAKHLQAIEDNPLDAEQVAMFEMFDREGWSDERRRDYIRRRALRRIGVSAAE